MGVCGEWCVMMFENVVECVYLLGWCNYYVVVSYDWVDWFCVLMMFDGKMMIIDYMFEFDSIYYVYFELYLEECYVVFFGVV